MVSDAHEYLCRPDALMEKFEERTMGRIGAALGDDVDVDAEI